MQDPTQAPYGFIGPEGYRPPQPARQRLPFPIAVLLGLIAACAVLSCFATAQAIFNPQRTSAPSTLSTHLPTETSALFPTEASTSAGPQPIFAATLGGTPDDFTAKFGSPVSEGVWSATIGGQDVEINADPARGTDIVDGQPHIYIISVLGNGTWSQSTETTIAKTFLPQDAKHVKDVNASNGARDHIYSSASLKATFKASIFTNDSLTKKVTPGYLSYQCFNFSTGYSECIITVGTHD